MYCGNCGKLNLAGAVFCEECGTKIVVEPTPQEETKVYDNANLVKQSCHQCGSPYEAGEKFCGNCGTEVGMQETKTFAAYQEAPVTNVEKPKKKSNKKRNIILGSSLAVILVLAGIFTWLFMTTGKQAATNQFLQFYRNKQYEEIAKTLATDSQPWDKAAAEKLVAYIQSPEGIAEFESKLEELGSKGQVAGKEVLADAAQNELVQVVKTGSILGIFEQYQVKVKPITLSAKSRAKDAKLTIAGKTEALTKDQKQVAEFVPFITSEAKFEAVLAQGGSQSIVIPLDMKAIKGGKLSLDLNPLTKTIFVTVPEEIAGFEDSQVIFANGKREEKNPYVTIETFPNQKIEVYAEITSFGKTYTTEKLMVDSGSSEDDAIEAELTFSVEVVAQLQKDLEGVVAERERMETFLEQYYTGFSEAVQSKDFAKVEAYLEKDSEAYALVQGYLNSIKEQPVANDKVSYPVVIKLSQVDDTYVVESFGMREISYNDGKATDTKFETVHFTLKKNGESYIITKIVYE